MYSRVSLLCLAVSNLGGLDPTIPQGAHPLSMANLDKSDALYISRSARDPKRPLAGRPGYGEKI